MKTLGAVYSCYKNKKATEFALTNFRNHFPENPIYLMSDGGDNFQDLADKFNCKFVEYENIQGTNGNYPHESFRIRGWWERHKRAIEYCKTDYMMIMEDDVYVKNSIIIDDDFHQRGVRGPNFPESVKNDIRSCNGIEVPFYGMCGGSIYNSKTFLSIYDSVIKEINEKHDEITKNPDYSQVGAFDANLTYHFSKRGYPYELSKWLSQINHDSYPNPEIYPLIHNYKIHY